MPAKKKQKRLPKEKKIKSRIAIYERTPKEIDRNKFLKKSYFRKISDEDLSMEYSPL